MAASSTIAMGAQQRSPSISMSLDISDHSPAAATSPPNSLSCNPSPTPTPRVLAFSNGLGAGLAETQAAAKQQESYVNAMRQTEGLSWRQMRASMPEQPIPITARIANEQTATAPAPAAAQQQLAAQALSLLDLVDTVLRGTGHVDEQAASIGHMLQAMHMRFASWSAASFVPARSLPTISAPAPHVLPTGITTAAGQKDEAQSPKWPACHHDAVNEEQLRERDLETLSTLPEGVKAEEHAQLQEEQHKLFLLQQLDSRAPYFAARVQDESDESDESAQNGPAVLSTRLSSDRHTDSADKSGPQEREGAGSQLRSRLSVNSLLANGDNSPLKLRQAEAGAHTASPCRLHRQRSPEPRQRSPRSRSRSLSAGPGDRKQQRSSRDRDSSWREKQVHGGVDVDNCSHPLESRLPRTTQRGRSSSMERQQGRDNDTSFSRDADRRVQQPRDRSQYFVAIDDQTRVRQQGVQQSDRRADDAGRVGVGRDVRRRESLPRKQGNAASRMQDLSNEGSKKQDRSPQRRAGREEERSQQRLQQSSRHDRVASGREVMPTRAAAGRQGTRSTSREGSPVKRRWRSISPADNGRVRQEHQVRSKNSDARQSRRVQQQQSPQQRHDQGRQQHQRQERGHAQRHSSSPVASPSGTPAHSNSRPKSSPRAATGAEVELEEHPCLWSSGAEEEDDALHSDHEAGTSDGPPLYAPSPAARKKRQAASAKLPACCSDARVEAQAPGGEPAATAVAAVEPQAPHSPLLQQPQSPCGSALPAPSPSMAHMHASQPPIGGPFAAIMQKQELHDSLGTGPGLATLGTVDSAQLDAALGLCDWSPHGPEHELHLQPQQAHADTDGLLQRHLFASDDGQLGSIEGMHGSAVQYADDDGHDVVWSEQPKGEYVCGDDAINQQYDGDYEDVVQQLLESGDEEMHDDDDDHPQQRAEEDTDQHAELDTDQHAELDTDQHAEQDTDQHAEQDTDQHAEQDTDQHADVDTHQHAKVGTDQLAEEDVDEQQHDASAKHAGSHAGKEAPTARYPDGAVIHFFSHDDMHPIMRRHRLPLLNLKRSSQQQVTGQPQDARSTDDSYQQHGRNKLLGGTALLMFCNTERRLLHGMYCCRRTDQVETLEAGDWHLKPHVNSQTTCKSPPSFELAAKFYEEERFSSLPLEEMEDVADLENVQRACLNACRAARDASADAAHPDKAFPALLPSITVTLAQSAALWQLMQDLQARKRAKQEEPVLPPVRGPSPILRGPSPRELKQLRQAAVQHKEERQPQNQGSKLERFTEQRARIRGPIISTLAHIERAQRQLAQAGGGRQAGSRGACSLSPSQGRNTSRQHVQQGDRTAQGWDRGVGTGARAGQAVRRYGETDMHNRQPSPGRPQHSSDARQTRLGHASPQRLMRRQCEASPPKRANASERQVDRAAAYSPPPTERRRMEREAPQHAQTRGMPQLQGQKRKVIEQHTDDLHHEPRRQRQTPGSRWVSPGRDGASQHNGADGQQSGQQRRSVAERLGTSSPSRPMYRERPAAARHHSQARDSFTPEVRREQDINLQPPAHAKERGSDQGASTRDWPRPQERGYDSSERSGTGVRRMENTGSARDQEPAGRAAYAKPRCSPQSRSSKRARH